MINCQNINTTNYKRVPCIIINKTKFFKLKLKNSRDTDNSISVVPTIDSSPRVVDTDKIFWNIISILDWKDKSEYCNKRKLNRLTFKQRIFLRKNILLYTTELYKVIEKSSTQRVRNIFNNPYFNIDMAKRETKINNVLYHIVAKGSQFYHACIIDPEFAMYIVGEMEFLPLYTYLITDYSKKSNISESESVSVSVIDSESESDIER